MIVVWFSNVMFGFCERPISFNISTYLKQASRKTGQCVNPHTTSSMFIGLISKTHHKTTPMFLLQFISTAATEIRFTFKTLFIIINLHFPEQKKCHGVCFYVSVCMMKKANPPHLIWVVVELNLAIGSVVGLQWIVHPVPSSTVLDMLLQHRVPVYQEPTRTFRILSDYWGNCMKTKEKAACGHMSSQTIWWTDLPPQTYFLTNITPAAVLSSITMMTVITMETVLEEGFFTCKHSKIN